MINIDLERDKFLTEIALKTLTDKGRYMLPDETSPQQAFARAAMAFSDNPEHAQRIYDYVSKGWFMYASPILSNGGTNRGLPISCFGGYVDDSRDGICSHYTENAWLSSMGGGIGGYWGHVRSDGTGTSRGSQSTGIIPFMHVVDSQMLAFSQGRTRRGSYAAYLDISHPEVEEFLDMRKTTGDANRRNINLHHAVNIPDAFMRKVTKEDTDDNWSLIDPHTKNTVKVVSAIELWKKVLRNRVELGEPYIHFIDTSNRFLPQALKNKGLKVHQSNLCSEIILPTNNERTFVCCLSSVNLEYFDDWKQDSLFIDDLVRFLDNVLEYFINNAPQELEKAQFSAIRERSIGLGAMGWHSFLQKNNIPFESSLAMSWNKKIFEHIKSLATVASIRLAKERGEAPDMEGTGMRNAHLLAIAPNATSSLICGTSPSIEPWNANVFVQKTLSGSFIQKNKYLEVLLEKYEKNNGKVWKDIVSHNGSVQHLNFMSDDDKKVFRTAREIKQDWIIKHAADRQPFICQAQSLNLFFNHGENAKYIHELHIQAWVSGLKTLYYVRGDVAHDTENVENKVELKKISSEEECVFCEG